MCEKDYIHMHNYMLLPDCPCHITESLFLRFVCLYFCTHYMQSVDLPQLLLAFNAYFIAFSTYSLCHFPDFECKYSYINRCCGTNTARFAFVHFKTLMCCSPFKFLKQLCIFYSSHFLLETHFSSTHECFHVSQSWLNLEKKCEILLRN